MSAAAAGLERLYVITDRQLARRGLGPVEAVVEAALEGGARFFQLRDKERSPADTWRLGTRLAEHWIDAGANFVVNDRADMSLALEGDGVHRPGNGLPVSALRQVVGERGLVGVSTHDFEEARAAEQQGADFITLSPVFNTPSKPDYGPPLGLSEFETIVRQLEVPVYALGGITPERVEDCLEAGAYGVAVMSGIMAADAPKKAARAYAKAVDKYLDA
jgi:thiamine-phosphate diphosphorylase